MSLHQGRHIIPSHRAEENPSRQKGQLTKQGVAVLRGQPASVLCTTGQDGAKGGRDRKMGAWTWKGQAHSVFQSVLHQPEAAEYIRYLNEMQVTQSHGQPRSAGGAVSPGAWQGSSAEAGVCLISLPIGAMAQASLSLSTHPQGTGGV